MWAPNDAYTFSLNRKKLRRVRRREGRYLLELPFRDDRELVLDLLRHGAHVEVLAPAALRRKVRDEHAAAAAANG